jgi:hypothetical protein
VYSHITQYSTILDLSGVKSIKSSPTSCSQSLQIDLFTIVIKNFISVTSFLYLWENAISGEYVEYTNEKSNYSHSLLNVEHYMHFTSPIRRKVDIYNQLFWIRSIMMSQVMHLPNIEKINKDTKIIRKIQNECTLLHLLQNTTNENIITDGIIIQIINETKSLVYLPTYKCILSSMIICDLYTKIKCKIYIFEREHDYKKKIKISII